MCYKTGQFYLLLTGVVCRSVARCQERSYLAFPHKTHFDKTGVQGPDGKVVLTCASCHVPEPGGKLMAPIRFEAHCHDCHKARLRDRRSYDRPPGSAA